MKKFKFTNYRKKEVNEILFFNHHTDGGMENAVHKHFLSILWIALKALWYSNFKEIL